VIAGLFLGPAEPETRLLDVQIRTVLIQDLLELRDDFRRVALEDSLRSMGHDVIISP